MTKPGPPVYLENFMPEVPIPACDLPSRWTVTLAFDRLVEAADTLRAMPDSRALLGSRQLATVMQAVPRQENSKRDRHPPIGRLGQAAWGIGGSIPTAWGA